MRTIAIFKAEAPDIIAEFRDIADDQPFAGRILERVVTEEGDVAPVGFTVLVPNPKDFALPVVDVKPAVDEDVEALNGEPELIEILDDKVVRHWSKRSRLDEFKADAVRRIDREFLRHDSAPIELHGHTWHGDAKAIENIKGALLMFITGEDEREARPWTPMGALVPVTLTRQQIGQLGGAIGRRRDALYVKKKTKEAEVAALQDARAARDYDAAAGW